MWLKMFEKDGPMPFGPQMGLNKSMFNELREIIILWAISAEKNGLTGYKIEKHYKIPHTNVVRILNNLKKSGYIETNEEIVKGRTQKLCTITDNGVNHLKNLREKWAEKIEFLSDIVPPERFSGGFFGGFSSKMPHAPNLSKLPDFVEKFTDKMKTKEEAINFLTDMEKRFKFAQNRMQKRLDYLSYAMDDVKMMIDKIKNLTDYNPEELHKLIITRFEKFKKKMEEEDEK